MGLIITTISGGPPPFPLWYFKQNPQEIQKIFCGWRFVSGNLSAKVSFWGRFIEANKLCLTKKHHFVFTKRLQQHSNKSFLTLVPLFFKGHRYFPPCCFPSRCSDRWSISRWEGGFTSLQAPQLQHLEEVRYKIRKKNRIQDPNKKNGWLA